LTITGYDELSADDILIRDVVRSVHDAIVVEDYPDYPQRTMCPVVAERSRKSTGACCLGYSQKRQFSSSGYNGLQTEYAAMVQ
jgi:hypothetical protein